MESDKLYRVQKEDLPKVEKMLNQCFAHDPLYETLIPDPEVRKNLMPELFKCDMDEFYATCEIFADSAELNSVLVVSDEAEPIFHKIPLFILMIDSMTIESIFCAISTIMITITNIARTTMCRNIATSSYTSTK